MTARFPRFALLPLVAILALAAVAAQQPTPMRKAVALAAGTVYISPDAGSTPVGSVVPGADLAIEDHTDNFLRVFSGVSGWMPNTVPIVYLDDPQGPDKIYAAAMKLYAEAEKNSFERGTATDAARMFYRIYDDFPAGPYTAEALYRSGELTWKMNVADMPSRTDPKFRQFPDDSILRKVERNYPQTGWASRAAYVLLDERLTCGRWSEKPECIGKEIDIYKGFLKKYPASPDAPEAEYQILYRAAAGWTIYSQAPRHDAAKAAAYKQEVAATNADLQRTAAGTDAAAKAQKIADQVARGIPLKLTGNQ